MDKKYYIELIKLSVKQIQIKFTIPTFDNFKGNKANKNKYLPLPAATHSILDFVRSTPRRAQLSSCSTTGSSDCSNKSLSIDQFPLESPLLLQQQQQQLLQAQSTSIEMVCSTMRRQIISRAFYGWLAYCRHLSTVRTHLSGLVHGRITPESELARPANVSFNT